MLASLATRGKRLLASDIAPGVVLMVAALLALAVVNSPFGSLYDRLLATPVIIGIAEYALDKPLLLWINDGLMAIFFLYVALEIKEEMVVGRLSTWKQAALPAIAAAGGMLVPAVIYATLNFGDPHALRGWAIPTATDIAFAVGALALLGRRAPVALKVFLLALAILDDLGAIAIIALFYTADLSMPALALAAGGVGLLALLNRYGVRHFFPYLAVGATMWLCVLQSGVHPTMTGVILAMFIPLRTAGPGARSPLHVLKEKLAYWVTLGIMPVFGFANAGVSLGGLSPADLLSPIPLGIALGLFLGKQIGIFSISWAAVRLRICALPSGVTWTHMYGVAILAGIGFTMSLFIGTLAFTSPVTMAAVRIGVLSGSLLSGIVGYLFLRALSEAERKHRAPKVVPAEPMGPPVPHGWSHASGVLRPISAHRATLPARRRARSS